MNSKRYQIIFSSKLNALMVVGERSKRSGKSVGGSVASSAFVAQFASMTSFIGMLVWGLALISTAFAEPLANALPVGGVVVQGVATIDQSSNAMVIHQDTSKAIVNWQSFDIGAAARVNVIQPSSESVLLNRVVGNNPSQIFGSLDANGQVILINSHGILFGKDGSVNANAFTASTLDMRDADFMAGNYRYFSTGVNGEIVNQGGINAQQYVALIGASVINDGAINTRGGNVYLGAAEAITVPVSNSGRIRMELSPASINTAVENTRNGVIVTQGGQVYIQASSLNDAVANISSAGKIDTSGTQAGSVNLLADAGVINVSGSIVANSSGAANQGGDVFIGRDSLTGKLASATDVSGATLLSNKGFVETSGHALKVDGVLVNAANWLLDPDNIDITGDAAAATTGYSKIKASDIANALNAGTSVTVSTTAASSANQPAYKDTAGTGAGSAVTGDGNILISSAIVKSGANNASLSLLADNGIVMNARIGRASADSISAGKLDLTMTASGNASLSTNSKGITLSNVIDANGGLVRLSGTTKNTLNGSWNSDNTAYSGIIFNSNSGIKAATYEVTGIQNAPTSWSLAGVIFNGSNISLTSTTGNSFVRGTKDSVNASLYGAGVHFRNDSALTVTTGSGTSVISGTTVRISTSGNNVGITSNGNVTIGSLTENMSIRAGTINAASGTLSILGSFVELYNDGANLTGADNTTVNLKSAGNLNLSLIGEPSGALSVGNNASLNVEAGGVLQSYRAISAGAGGTVNIKASTANLNIGNDLAIRGVTANTVNITADNLVLNNSNGTNKLTATGTLTIANKTATQPINIGGVDASGTLGISQAELDQMTATSLIIGSNSAGNITVSSAITTKASAGDFSLLGNGNIMINSALTVGDAGATKNLTLNATGSASSVTQNAAIKATGLELLGANATYTLNNTSNDVSVLAGNTKIISYFDTNALTIGSVGSVGLSASGTIKVETNNSISVTQAILTSDTSNAAIYLNAGKSTAAGTAGGGDVQVSGAGGMTVGSGGRATLMTGSILGSTGVTALVGSGSGNFRYNSDEVATNYSTALGAGTYAVYREAPSAALTMNSDTKIYNGLVYTGGNGYTLISGGVNGDSATQMGASVAYGGTAQNAKNVGSYSITNTSSASALGYNLSYGAGTLTVNRASLSASLVGLIQKEYDGTTAANNLTNTNFNLTGWINGEGATLNQSLGAYSSANVNSNTPSGKGSVTANLSNTNFTANSGTDLNNYNLPAFATGNIGVITPATLLVKVNNTSAFVTQDARNAIDQGFVYTGFKNGENENTALSGAYIRTYSNGGNNTPVAGTYNGVYGLSASPVALNVNYSISVQNGNLTVVPADKLLITIASQSDVYGNLTSTNAGEAGVGTVTAQYCFDSGCSSVSSLTMTKFSATQWKAADNTNSYVVFDTSLASPSYSSGGYLKAGSYRYTASEIVPLSLPNGNFTGQATNGGVLTVNTKALTLNASNVTKVYDGTNVLAGMTLTPTGVMSGDVIGVSSSGGTFAGVSAGSQTFNLTGLQLEGSDRSNYSFATNSLTGTGSITPKVLTIIGGSAEDKMFDGNTSVKFVPGVINGLVGNESLTLSSSAVFVDPAVGSNKNVLVTYNLANGSNGGLATNYKFLNANPPSRLNSVLQASIKESEPFVNPVTPRSPTSPSQSRGSSSSVLSQQSVGQIVKPQEPAKQCSVENLEVCNCQDTLITEVLLCILPLDDSSGDKPVEKPSLKVSKQ